MSLPVPKSIVRGIVLLRQESGSGQKSCWLVWNLWGSFASLCFPFWRSVQCYWGDCSHPDKSCSPQGVISLLLFIPVWSPCHINIHLPFHFSSPASSLATPGFMWFRNVSSWDPGNIFVCSPFSPICLSHWLWVPLSKFSPSQINSLHNTAKEVMKRQEDPLRSSWASPMLCLEPGPVTLEAQEYYRTKVFVRQTLLQQKDAMLTCPPVEVPNGSWQFW